MRVRREKFGISKDRSTVVLAGERQEIVDELIPAGTTFEVAWREACVVAG